MKLSRIKLGIVLIVSIMSAFSSCGKTENNKSKDGSAAATSQTEVHSSKETSEVNYTFKSTEELLANEKNVDKTDKGYIIVNDINDVPEPLKNMLFPYRDPETKLYGYKDLTGDIVIEPQFYLAYCFSAEGIGYAVTTEESSELGFNPGVAIRTDGSLITDPNTSNVVWVDDDYIKYYDKDFVPHIVDKDLNEIDLEDYYSELPEYEKYDISYYNFGYDQAMSGYDGKAYLKYKNGFLPVAKYDEQSEKYTVSLLNDKGEKIAEHEDYYSSKYISCVSNDCYVVVDERFMGSIYDTDGHRVDEIFEFGKYRPMESIVFQGGYTYVFGLADNDYLDEIPTVIKIVE